MKISILHPSRGRPNKSFDTINKFIDRAGQEIEVIISLDEDDPELNNYKRLYAGRDYRKFRYYAHNNKSAVEAINLAAISATTDILFVVSDDTDCENSWATTLLEFIGDRKDFVLKTQDGIQSWIITNPILDWTYYKRFDYVYHPEFDHMFCDTFLTCVADLTGRKIVSNQMFRHLKYEQTPDYITKKCDATWNSGENTFLKFARQNFLLKPEDVKGKIESPDYIHWMKRKLR